MLAVAHKVCIGAALELFAAADMRYATDDCIFSIREPRMGLAADLGALQRMPRLCTRNIQLCTELCYTGRDFSGKFAEKQLGFCSAFPDFQKAKDHAMEIAREISKLSPVAITATKRTLTFSREHSESEGLEYVRNLNGALLQSQDPMIAVSASITKTKPVFSKL